MVRAAVNQTHVKLDHSARRRNGSGVLPTGDGRLMRLNVFLQKAGVGSRREAERMVEQGRVKVNGAVAAPTVPVNDGDMVELDGKPLSPDTRAQPRLFLLHKPIDVLVTTFDQQGRRTVFDLRCLKPPQWGPGHTRA